MQVVQFVDGKYNSDQEFMAEFEDGVAKRKEQKIKNFGTAETLEFVEHIMEIRNRREAGVG